MFQRISTKLAVLYAGLFGAILVVVSLAVFTAISHNAAHMVRDELQAGGAVFDRTWALRSRQLQDGASLLSRDFGFRAAVGTGDAATVGSALQNLRGRLGLDLAFMVGVDGKVTTSDGRALGSVGQQIYKALDDAEDTAGVFMLGGTPYQAVSAPILAPSLIGWVVFAQKLDDKEMTALEQLSAIPFDAMVLDRRKDGTWLGATGSVEDRESAAVSRLIASAAADPKAGPQDLASPSGPAIALVKPLDSLLDGEPVVLLMRYPLAKAMEPFQPLIQTLFVTGGLGVLLVSVGSFLLAGSLSKPIAALDEAARRLKRGEEAAVTVKGSDEIGRLAESFNAMAAEIRDRETKMRRDAETLAVALDRAQTANRATNAFLANMSHEVRTPLNGVLGLSQVLAATAKDAGQTRIIASVISSAEALSALLSDILDAAQMGAGQTEVHTERFHLASTVRATADVWAAAAARRGLAFGLDLCLEAESVVTGDPSRLKQILENLLSNAVKFTAAGAVALTVTRARGDRFVFEVTDTGLGFDPAVKERLFQPFQQADGSSTRRYGGTGLGLPISRGLAELMGGTLDGDPRPQGGSRFVLELPLPPEAGAALAETAGLKAIA